MPWKKTDIGKTIGGSIGGSIGGGVLGTVAGSKIGQRLDPRLVGQTIGGTIGGSIGGAILGKKLGGVIGGKWFEDKAKQQAENVVDNRPQLSPWEAMKQENVRATDLYRPTTVTGSEIQRQMEESPWYKMALQKQGLEEANLMNQAAAQQAGALAGSRSQLAMRGGLRGGSAERLAMSGAENLASTMQKQRMAGALERSNLGMQSADLASKLAQANAQTLTEAQARNIGAGISELDKQRAYELAKYQEQMKGYAAEKTGQALGKEPKPGLFSDPIGYFGSMFNK